MTTHAPRTTDTELRPEVFDDYKAFVKEAVREYYDLGWKHRRGNFIALLIASGQALSLATDSVKDGTGLKKAAMGAAGVGPRAPSPLAGDLSRRRARPCHSPVRPARSRGCRR